MTALEGCTVTAMDEKGCLSVIERIAGGEAPGQPDFGFTWLLAYCRDGVTWGRREGSRWRLSSEVFPELCPAVSRENLSEMRLFGKEGELLVWRSDEGFQGRILRDKAGTPNDSPTRPHDEVRILVGDRLVEGPRDGFSRVGTASGIQQAIPLECTERDFAGGRWPLRLKVRHYFGADRETGVVRVAASRLVVVYKE